MSRKSRWEYFRAVYQRYWKATKEAKRVILDEFCSNAGYHRKYAIRILNGPEPEKSPRRRRRRARYRAGVIRALAGIWEAAGYPWSVRLKALLPLWMRWARKRLSIDNTMEGELLRISPSTMDRRLKDRKEALRKRHYGRTRPGSLLKHHIPIKTDNWDVRVPGFVEVDLVSHSGNCGDGEFIHSLNMTDIHTGWVETGAVMGKGQARVVEAMEQMRQRLPFPLQGIDSDNGSEFINAQLKRYCDRLGIQFTRGRPYKKDDNAHIEQKNWTHVRKVFGYLRFESEAVLEGINDLYGNELRLYQNLFQPSVKLLGKIRVGSRLRRRYDRPKTPFQRASECCQADAAKLAQLRRQMQTLDPFELSRRIEQKLDRIFGMANAGMSPRGPKSSAGPNKSANPRVTPPHERGV